MQGMIGPFLFPSEQYMLHFVFKYLYERNTQRSTWCSVQCCVDASVMDPLSTAIVQSLKQVSNLSCFLYYY